jgi:hypothetical protein
MALIRVGFMPIICLAGEVNAISGQVQALLLEAHLGLPISLLLIIFGIWAGLVVGSFYLVRRALKLLRSGAGHEQAVGVMLLMLVATGWFLFSKLWGSI